MRWNAEAFLSPFYSFQKVVFESKGFIVFPDGTVQYKLNKHILRIDKIYTVLRQVCRIDRSYYPSLPGSPKC